MPPSVAMPISDGEDRPHRREAREAAQRLAEVFVQADLGKPEGALRDRLPRFALAILRQRILPAIEVQPSAGFRVQVAMFGGTNTGKSTVLNLLLGRPAAGIDFRARFSQHPEAYLAGSAAREIFDAAPGRFVGYARHENEHPPRQTDADLREHGYRPALAIHDLNRLEPTSWAPPAGSDVVWWDAPDFSTEEAQHYLPAVFDALALADLVVMTVTSESYADHRGGQLLRWVAATGSRLLLVANKVDSADLRDDIAEKLSSSSGIPPATIREALISLPTAAAASEAERLEKLRQLDEVATLRQVVAKRTQPPRELRRQAERGGIQFLRQHLDACLAPLKAEAEIAAAWGREVQQAAQREILDRYRRDYLDSQEYGDFNLAMLRLLDLLELPVIGQFVSFTARLIRMPVQWAFQGVRSLFVDQADEKQKSPEEEVVLEAYEQWLRTIRGVAQARREQADTVDERKAWDEITRRLNSQALLDEMEDDLAQAYVKHRERMAELIDERADAVWESIQDRPALRHTLQGSKFLLDAAATLGAVLANGLDPYDLLIAPLVAPIMRYLLEMVGEQYMEQQKELLKDEQLAALSEVIEQSLLRKTRGLYTATVSDEQLAAAHAHLETLAAAVESNAK